MNSEIALAFVGALVPDETRYHTSAFNRAGNNFQYQLIRGLALHGISDIEVFSVRPIPSYPTGSALWIPQDREQLDGHIPVRLLPFLNLTPLKQIVLGLNVLLGLAKWGWRKRRAQRRLILTYNLSVPPGLFTLLGARLARAKAVVSVNDINVPGETVPASLLWRLDLQLQRWLLPKFDGHLAVSDQIARDFFPGRAYVRVEGGVDGTFLERTRRIEETNTPANAPFVLTFAGSLNDANGLRIVLAAFKILRDLDLRLRIAGSGPLHAVAEEATRQDSRIEYVGALDAAGVAALYATSNVLLNIRLTKALNTRYFFPSKLLEYLASGVPTITTNVGHAEDEFGGLAYVLRNESPEGLAELVSFVASRSPDERKGLGKKARAYVSEYKTWDAQTARVVKYLREIVR